MDTLLYHYRCRTCGLSVESSDRSGPTAPACATSGVKHTWVRGTDARHHAFHEAAHAVVATRLAGRVHAIEMVRNVAYSTLYEFAPYAPGAMVTMLAGGHGERLLGVVPAGDIDDHARFRVAMTEWLALGLIGTQIGHLPAARFARAMGEALVRVEADFEAAAADVVAASSDQIRHLGLALVARREMDEGQVQIALRQAGACEPWSAYLPPLDSGYRTRLWSDLLADA